MTRRAIDPTVLLATSVLTITACTAPAPPITIRVLDAAPAPITLDLLTQRDAEGRSVNEHFDAPKHPRAMRYTLRPGDTAQLDTTSEAWRAWPTSQNDADARDLVAFANIPGRFANLPPIQDPRRLAFSASQSIPVELTISATGITAAPTRP